MKRLITVSAATVLLAGSASAQALGCVGGQVSGQVGVGAQLPPVAGTVGSTMRGAGDMTRDTLRDTRGALRDSRPDVHARVGVNADTRVSRNQTDVSAALRTGAMVRASDGALVGSVVGVTRNASGRAASFTLRTIEGSTRTVRATSVGVSAGALVTTGR